MYYNTVHCQGTKAVLILFSCSLYSPIPQGTCAPYAEVSELCNNYINDTSYVYSIGASTQAQVDMRLSSVERFIQSQEDQEPVCVDMVARIVCNFYFPPCGSEEGVHLPLSVCKEECDYVSETCSDLWDEVHGFMMDSPNLEILFCNQTHSRFNGFVACCSGVGIQLPGMLCFLEQCKKLLKA